MIEQAVRGMLLAAPEVAAAVGDRVGPWTLGQGGELPAVTYFLVGATLPVTFGGPPGVAATRVQVDAWARSYAEVAAVAGAVVLALHNRRGAVAGVDVLGAWVDTVVDGHEADVGLYRRTVSATVWHR